MQQVTLVSMLTRPAVEAEALLPAFWAEALLLSLFAPARSNFLQVGSVICAYGDLFLALSACYRHHLQRLATFPMLSSCGLNTGLEHPKYLATSVWCRALQ